MRRNRVLAVFAIVLSMSAIIFWLGNVFAAATVVTNEGLTVSEAGSGVITNTLLLSEDPDAPGVTLTYTLVTTPANGDLRLSGTPLAISDTFTQADVDASLLDYAHNDSETLSDSFDFTVETSATITQSTFLITITPVYDQIPVVDDQVFNVDENSGTGTAVDTIIATDLDAADALTYTIINGNTGSPFAVGSSDGAVTVDSTAPLDFETNQTLTFTVQVEDLGTLTDTAVITVNLNDVNEAPTISGGPFSIPENSNNGTSVGTVITTDVDANDTFTYTITASDPAAAFAINGSGDISVSDQSLLNFEITPTFTLTVEIEDSGLLTGTANIVINLTNVNDPPVLTPAGPFSLQENTPNPNPVGSPIIANDDDIGAGDMLTYTITAGNSGGAFSIGSSNGQITVANGSLLDFETPPTSYNLTIQVIDSAGATDSETVTINLTNANEKPTVNDGTFNINENSLNTTDVGTIIGSDPDAADSGALTFDILTGNIGNAFTISNDGSNNGDIKVADSSQLDFETNPIFTLGIAVTDTEGLEATASVTIDINNLFDETPTVNDATFFVAEGSPDGAAVGTVSASDPELVSGDVLTFSISSGNTGTVFAINSSSGEITVPDASKLDADAMPTFNLTVQAIDKGGQIDTGIITVNVSPLPITYLFLPTVLNDYPPVEPNNNCTQSYGIGTGFDYEFTADDTEDWYAVTLSSAGNLTIVLSSFEPAQGQLIVYGGSCNGLTLLQNNGDATTTKTINLGTQPAGTYYIRVFSAPITNTTYNLRVN